MADATETVKPIEGYSEELYTENVVAQERPRSAKHISEHVEPSLSSSDEDLNEQVTSMADIDNPLYAVEMQEASREERQGSAAESQNENTDPDRPVKSEVANGEKSTTNKRWRSRSNRRKIKQELRQREAALAVAQVRPGPRARTSLNNKSSHSSAISTGGEAAAMSVVISHEDMVQAVNPSVADHPVTSIHSNKKRTLPPLEKNLQTKTRKEKLQAEGISLTRMVREPLPSISQTTDDRTTDLGLHSIAGTSETHHDLEGETTRDVKRDILGTVRKAFCCCVDDATGKLRDRRCCIIVITTIICSLIITGIVLVPVGLIRLEHYELGLKMRTHEKTYYSKPTYYPGIYMLGPGWQFIKFPYSAIMMHYEELSVFTVSRLIVTFEVSFQYFLRPDEIGELYKKFGDNYETVFERISRSTLRNTIAVFTVDEMRFNRTLVERASHLALHRKLAGTCCMKCCRRNTCNGPAVTSLCNGCDASKESCDPGFHVEVKYFQLGLLKLRSAISDRLLYNILLHERIELMALNQNVSLVRAETQRQVELIENSANEISANGSAVGELQTTIAHAIEDQILQNATLTGWSGMNDRFNLTREDHKLSLLWINTLDKMDNLVWSPDFTKYSRAASVP